MRDQRVVLVDDRTGVETVLDAEFAPNRGVARAAVFDDTSTHVFYFRAAGDHSDIVMRTLATGMERTWPMPPGLAWRIEPEHGSAWLRVSLVDRDTDRNGELEGMDRETEGAGEHRCKGEVDNEWMSSMADAHRVLWLDTATGAIDKDPHVVGHLGAARIVRAADGAVRIGAQTVVPPDCRGKILVVVPAPVRVVVACEGTGRGVEIFGPFVHATVQGTPAPPREDKPNDNHMLVRDVRALCRVGLGCFRVSDGEVLARHGVVIGDQLVRIDGAVTALDLRTGREVPLAVHPVAAPRARSLDRVVFDRTIAMLGEVARPPLALDAAGRALVPAGGCARELCLGPLRWVTPRPARPAAAPVGVREHNGLTSTTSGTVVARAGAPVANAMVAINEYARERTWTFPTRRAGRRIQLASSMARVPDLRTDAGGAFTVPLRPFLRRSALVAAPDGRIGLIGGLDTTRAGLVVTLAAPGELRVTCTRKFGSVTLRREQLELGVRCGDVISGLPAGRYRMLAERDNEDERVLQSVDIAPGGRAEVRLGAAVHEVLRARVIRYPGGQPIAGAPCVAYDGGAEEDRVASGTTGADGSVAMDVQPGDYDLWCGGDQEAIALARVRVHVPGPPAVVPRVTYRREGVTIEVEGDAEPRGLRIRYAEGRAVRAGMQVGDLVTAVDGVALAGLDEVGMQALAFTLAPEAAVQWTVERAGQPITLTAEAF